MPDQPTPNAPQHSFLWKLTVVLVIILVLLLITGLIVRHVLRQQMTANIDTLHARSFAVDCTMNIKMLSTAARNYALDHNNHLPHADRWTTDLKPYLFGMNWLHCRADRSGHPCSYGMNAALSDQDQKTVSPQAVLFFETSAPGDSPSGGQADVISPARHTEGSNFALCNGTVSITQEIPTAWK